MANQRIGSYVKPTFLLEQNKSGLFCGLAAGVYGIKQLSGNCYAENGIRPIAMGKKLRRMTSRYMRRNTLSLLPYAGCF